MTFLAACPPGHICTPNITANPAVVAFWVAFILLLSLPFLGGSDE